MALELACEHLLSLQDRAGWWQGELQTNVTMDAEDMLLREFLGIRRGDETERSAAWIRSQQRADGTWTNFYGGPGDLSTTIEAYWALRLAGDPPEAEHMRIAAEFVRAQGGLAGARVFTHLWLALFGLWSWEDVPALPPEIVLLPSWFPLNIYDFACWARQTIVALSLVKTHRPARELPFDLGELQVTGAQPTDEPLAAAARSLAGARRPPAARLRTPPAATVAADRAGARRALDRAPPGGRRLVGRHPAAVGLLADRAAPVRLRARPSGDAPRAGGCRGLHGRGPRRLARRRRAARAQPSPGSVPVAGVGHGARADRAERRRAGRRSPRARARRRLAARRGGDDPGRLVGRPPAARPRRLGVRVRQRQLPRRRRHGRGRARAAPRQGQRAPRRRRAARRRLGARGCRAPVAAGAPSTPRTRARWCASCRSWTSAR